MFKDFKFRLFAKILIFYICALLVPFLMCGTFLTKYTMSSYRDEILDLNINTTNYIRSMIDENIEDVDIIRLLIYQNSEIMDFVSNNNLSHKEKAYYAKQMADEINKYRIYNSSIRGIHLYSSASDCVITNNNYYSKEEYFNKFLTKSGLSFEQWCEKLHGTQSNSIPVISLVDNGQNSTGLTTATIMQPVIRDGQGNLATLLVVLDAENIIKTYKELVSSGNTPYFAITSDTEILIESKTPPFEIKVKSLLAENTNSLNAKDGYITVTSTSRTSGLNYICIMSEQQILGKVRSINKFLMLSIVIMSLILIVIAYVFSNKTFSPIRTLAKLEITDKNYSFDSIKDFQGFMVNIINSNKQLSDAVTKQRKCINDTFFKTFIQNSMSIEQDTLNTIFADTSIPADSECFRVAIVDFEEFDSTLDSEKNLKAILYLQDTLNEYGIRFYVIPNENLQKILLLECGDCYANIKLPLNKIVNHLEKNEDVHSMICVGRVVNSLNKFTKSYEDAFFEISSNRNGGVYLCDELTTISYAEYFKFIKKDKLIFDVRSGNEETVKEFFGELKNRIFVNYTTTYGIQNYVRYLLDSIFKEAIDTDILSDSHRQKFSIKCSKSVELHDIAESFEKLEQCFLNAARCISEGKVEKRNDIISDIIKYVKGNFQNPDISLKQIAEEMDVSSYKYISEAFKRKVGMKFSDYLHDVRNEEAKRLLLTTDLMVFEIADKVGYLGSNAFVKNFKKLNGITPGDFRKSSKL